MRQFVDQLARRLQQGRSLVREIHEEIFPDEGRFFHLDDAPRVDTEAEVAP